MTTLTTQQLDDFRADIGDSQGAFSDAELQRLYERAAVDYNGAVVLALRQLLMNAAKFTDYSAGANSERRSQLFAHLRVMVTEWEQLVTASRNQIQIVGLKAVPPRSKDEP